RRRSGSATHDLREASGRPPGGGLRRAARPGDRHERAPRDPAAGRRPARSEEHTSELQSLTNLVCRLLLEKKNYAAKRMTWVVRGTLVKRQRASAFAGRLRITRDRSSCARASPTKSSTAATTRVPMLWAFNRTVGTRQVRKRSSPKNSSFGFIASV